MDSLGLLYEKPSGFCKEGALHNLYTEQILPMGNYFSYICRRRLQFCVCCVCLHHGCLSLPCIHDLKDIFVNCPGFARFQAKGRTRNKLLFDNNKMLFFSYPSNQQAGYKEDIYLLFEDLAVQLCSFGVIIRSQNGTFGKPCGFNKGQSSLSCHLYCYFFL